MVYTHQTKLRDKGTKKNANVQIYIVKLVIVIFNLQFIASNTFPVDYGFMTGS